MNRDQQSDGWTFPELLAGLADGELGKIDSARVESWLASHPEAAADLEVQRHLGRRHSRLWSNSAAPLPPDVSWSRMAVRVLTAIQIVPKSVAAPANRSASRRRLLFAAAAFAAAVLAAVVMFRPPSVGDSISAAPDEAFVVASEDDVEIMRILEADTGMIVFGELPLRGLIVLASIEDIHGLKVVKDTDGMMPMVQMQPGPNAPMIFVPMAGK